MPVCGWLRRWPVPCAIAPFIAAVICARGYLIDVCLCVFRDPFYVVGNEECYEIVSPPVPFSIGFPNQSSSSGQWFCRTSPPQQGKGAITNLNQRCQICNHPASPLSPLGPISSLPESIPFRVMRTGGRFKLSYVIAITILGSYSTS